MRRGRRRGGLALLLVVGVVAVLVALVLHFHAVSADRLRLAGTVTERTRALALARSAVLLTWEVLADDRRPFFTLPATAGDRFQQEQERLSDLERAYLWLDATSRTPAALEGGKIAVDLTDDMGRVSLNRTTAGALSALIQRLGIMKRDVTDIVGKGLRRDKSREMACALVDWRDADSAVEAGLGAEEPHYRALNLPYRPRNGPVPCAGELMLIRDFDRDVLDGPSVQAEDETTQSPLLPYVTPFGAGAQVNVNTAPAPVIRSLPGIHESAAGGAVADALLANRPFRSMSEVRDIVTTLDPGVWNTLFPSVTLTSNRFRIRVSAWVGASRASMETVLLKQGREPAVLLWKEH